LNPQAMKTLTHLLGLALFCTAAPAFAQVPNAGFENWTDYETYEDPTGWTSLNIVSVTFGDVATCERVSPGFQSANAVRVMTVDVPGFGVLPGLLLSGEPDAAADGFPYTQRPGALTGMWKAEVGAGDAAVVGVVLYRWNASAEEREVIGSGEVMVTGTVASWTAFNIPIEYASTASPDTASIFIASSIDEGVDGSSITVDALAFSAGTGMGEVFSGPSSIFPVPAHDQLNVVTPGVAIQQLELWSVDGRLVHAERPMADRVAIDVRLLAPGTYVLVARMADATVLRRSVLR